MNREIKFRVWNGHEMVYDVMVGKFGAFYVNPGDKQDGLDPKDAASLSRFTTKYHENIPVMEYTGLEDRNGKQIYEGDIIKYWGGIAPVVQHENGFYIQYSASDFYSLQYEGGKTEIIGNIYKNYKMLNP